MSHAPSPLHDTERVGTRSVSGVWSGYLQGVAPYRVRENRRNDRYLGGVSDVWGGRQPGVTSEAHSSTDSWQVDASSWIIQTVPDGMPGTLARRTVGASKCGLPLPGSGHTLA